MKVSKTFLTHSPFRGLQALLEANAVSLPAYREIAPPVAEVELGPEAEEMIFAQAMKGVRPIARDGEDEWTLPVRLPRALAPCSGKTEDAETVSELADLVRSGTGFHIRDTAEYVEGTGYQVPGEIARRLHQGDYSIQAHVDLHGMNADNARVVFERFLKWAVITGKNGVLVIHGRGLSSPSGPVLKEKVIAWLTRGPWRRWIVAYASARNCDGGAGATYVLLRQRPVTKKARRRQRTFI